MRAALIDACATCYARVLMRVPVRVLKRFERLIPGAGWALFAHAMREHS